MAFDWITAEIPLAAGLDTKGDLRAGKPPKLDIARDVWFEEPGGVQPRFPYLAFSNQIFGGGTLANCRRLAVVNDELCVFTDTALYSWNAQLLKWVLRGAHPAVTTSETPAFSTIGDQTQGDRAELNGTVVFTWCEGVVVYAAAFDKTTGSVLASPTVVSTAIYRPRLVALATKILLFVGTGNDITVRAIDPATPSVGISGVGTTVIAAVVNLFYDVVRVDSQDLVVGACRRNTTTSYSVFTVSSALTVTTVTKARTCDGAIAVSTIPGGTQTQVVRGNGTNVQGDLLTTATLADVITGQAIGTTAATVTAQIAACHRSVLTGGAFRCYVFWSDPNDAIKTNFVDNAGAIGTQSTMLLQDSLNLTSRAFDYLGVVHVWVAFYGASTVFGGGVATTPPISLQNTHFMYDDAGQLLAKASGGHANGRPSNMGWLPGVTVLSSTSFAWCSGWRRRIALSTGVSFAAGTPVDVVMTFDSNMARRSAVIGRTLYMTGTEVLQYDGVRIVEVGFEIFPWRLALSSAGGGSMVPGTYAYKMTLRYPNAQSESERSTTATIGTVTIAGSAVNVGGINNLAFTRKLAVPPAIEVWRTPIAPNVETPFYLVTSLDPLVTTNPNRYVANDPSALVGASVLDALADSSLITFETNPENGSVLESIAPPGATIIVSTDTRLFLAGVAGRPDEVWYSRLRGDGEIASFHDSLRIPVPRAGGDITALAFNGETLTVFRESAIYALPGDGLNNLGQGQNYGPARIISSDVGAISQETVALTPLGLVFKSSKGWYLLTAGWGLRYIGAAINAFDADTVHAVNVIETQHHVRIVQSGRVLIWDYSVVTEEQPLGQWAEWTVGSGIHAVMWQGQHVILTPTGPAAPRTEFTGADFGLDVETTWLKPAEQQGEFFLRWLAVLGEYRSAHLLRMRLARNYQYDGAGTPVYFDDFAWTPTPTVVGSALQVKHAPSINRMQALKVRITAVTEAARASLFTGSLIPQVATSGTAWGATWTAVSTLPGEMGNRVTMSIAFESGAANLIDVRDHYAYVAGRWTEDLNNIGVRVVRSSSPPTVAQLEAAIANVSTGTKLATLTTPDATPSKTINVSMVGQTSAQSFAGGAYGSPTGEALKLTSLALEYGLERGVNKRLPASQKAA